MEIKNEIKEVLLKIKTIELWRELGRRLNVKFGKIQMAYHQGEPSGYADVDVRIKVEKEEVGTIR